MAESQDASLVCINSKVFFIMSKCFWIIINFPTVPYYWFYKAKYIAFFCFPMSTTVLPPFGVTVLTVPSAFKLLYFSPLNAYFCIRAGIVCPSCGIQKCLARTVCRRSWIQA